MLFVGLEKLSPSLIYKNSQIWLGSQICIWEIPLDFVLHDSLSIAEEVYFADDQACLYFFITIRHDLDLFLLFCYLEQTEMHVNSLSFIVV